MHDAAYSHRHELDEHDFLGCCLNCRRSLEIIKPHVLGFYERIKEHTPATLANLPPEELYRKYQVLDDIAQLDVGDRLGELILTDGDIQGVLPAVRSYYAAFFNLHEAHLARELLAADDPLVLLQSYPLYSRYEVLVRTQGEALDLSPEDCLAFVGCGPLPLTLILMNRLFGTRCIGLESDAAAVALASECIGRMDLGRKVSIVHGDHSRLGELQWDVVLVAALAEPKSAIFQTLRPILKNRGRAPVVYRTYTGIRAVLYYPVKAEDIEGYRILRQIPPTQKVNNTLVFLELMQ